MAAHQVPPSMGLSRQEYWRGVPLPSHLTMSDLKSDFYMLHVILSQYWGKKSALLIIANIQFCSTSEYKGECPYSVEVRCDHVISVGPHAKS